MTLVWEHGPISSGELVRLCAKYLGWKKSTTYTEIKRLSQKGVLKNENAVVTPLVTREEVHCLLYTSRYWCLRASGWY